MRARNKLLGEPGPHDEGWLAALEARMAEHGAAIAEARTATVTARTPLKPYGLPVFVFRPFVEARPDVAWKLLEAMADRLAAAEAR